MIKRCAILVVLLLFSWVASLCLLSGAAEAALVRLLKPQQLGQLNGPYRIIDARPHSEWESGHIPGALPLHWADFTLAEEGSTYSKLAPEVMAERLGQLGIDEKTPLIVYGDADSSWGGEGWICWLLSDLGHVGEVYLLEGGVQAWKQQFSGLSMDRQLSPATAVSYRFAQRPEVDIATEELQQSRNRLQVVDTRSLFEWLRGSIPGAVRINWSHFFTGKERTPISREQLVELLRRHGIDPDKPVVYYCSGGVRSAYAWTVHELAGLTRAKNYQGGMDAWKMNRLNGKPPQ